VSESPDEESKKKFKEAIEKKNRQGESGARSSSSLNNRKLQPSSGKRSRLFRRKSG